MDIDKVYKKCDVCGGDLDRESAIENAKRGNYTFPICTSCMAKALEKSYRILTREEPGQRKEKQ